MTMFSYSDDVNEAQILIESKVNVDEMNYDGRTPLHLVKKLKCAHVR
jgi:ankyrin repeat protein